ncbi:PAS domain S-box protein [Sulfurimonas sp.]
MKKIITFLAKIGFWPFIILFTTIALMMTEILMILHSYWLTGSFFDKNLFIVGFTIPIIDGLIIFSIIAFLIRHLHKLEDSLNYEKKRAIQYLDITGTLIVALDTNANIVLANKKLCETLGYRSESDLIGKNWFEESLPVSKQELVKKVFTDIISGNVEPYKTFENELLFKNGEIRLIEWNNEYIRGNDGSIEGILSSGRDITKDRESEEEIRLMHHALNNVRESVYLVKKDGRFTYVNDSAQRESGYTKEELKKMGICDIDPNFPKSLMSSHWEELKQKGEITISTIHQHKAGNIFPVEVNANYIEYKGKEYNLAFVKDISERKITEEKLKLSASVFTNTHEGILITDKDNIIVDTNEAFTTITGFSKDDVIGEKPNILKSGRNTPEFYSELWTSLLKEGVWKGELYNRKKNGEEYVEIATISVVYNDNKEIQNFISIFTDITLEKQQQQELEHNAYYDALTNLPNRVLFADRMNQAIAHAIRTKQLIAVAYIDIDGFKQVNDSYGHDIGDKLLILLAEKMTNLLRENDTVSRIGGDEFISLFVDIKNKENIENLLNRLIDTIAEPISIDNCPINVSASVGVTFYPQKNRLEADQIIRQSDQAMYSAKESGKNKYIIFDSKEDSNYI